MQKVSKKSAPVEEKLPLHESLEVLGYTTISKTKRWWCAVVSLNSFGRKQVAVYLWQKKEDKWKRNQKLTIRKGDWDSIKRAVDNLLYPIEEKPKKE